MLVLGENYKSSITGAFLVRGDDHLAAFDVAPDWESYDFKKLDPESEVDKEFLRDTWTWDKPIEGKPIADGKVFK
jgi:elongation factor 1-gamma